MRAPKRNVRIIVALLTFVFATAMMLCVTAATSAKASAPHVELNADKAGPRQLEDSTGNAIVRDYSAAWQALSQALQQNDANLLGTVWVGLARDKFATAIEEQKKSGLRTRYVDHGHKLEAIFYSAEGGALQLRDTAELEIQVLDGATPVHSEQVTIHYLALMTPTSDHWQVRLLEAVP